MQLNGNRDKKDDNAIESTRLKKEINDLVKTIADLKDKLPVDKETAKTLPICYFL